MNFLKYLLKNMVIIVLKERKLIVFCMVGGNIGSILIIWKFGFLKYMFFIILKIFLYFGIV